MENKIRIHDIFKLSGNKIIFIIELIEGKFNINDSFIYKNLTFKIKGVGMNNKSFNKKSIDILVDILNEKYSLEDFKDKIFISSN